MSDLHNSDGSQADQVIVATAAPLADSAGGAAPTPPGGPGLSIRFSARDLVNVAIFGVIFIVVIWAVGMLGVISPLVWLLITPLQIVIAGIPFALFLTRVKHAGMISLFALIIALFFLFSGNSPISTVGIALLGVLADLIFTTGRSRSKGRAVLAYTVFSLGFFTPFLPLFIDREAYFATAVWEPMGQAYVEATDRLLSLPVLGLLALAIGAAGLAGGLIGSATLRKHFVRAGLA